jgi:hypothetical protein
MGPACHKTCRATTGTACYRLRTAAEPVSLVVTRMAHGCPRPARGVALGQDERPVAGWLGRAGVPGPAVQAPRVEHPRARGPVQADARRVKPHGGLVWRALAITVKTRVWGAGEVSSPRDMPRLRRRLERVRAWALQRPLWCCTEGLCADVRALRAPGRAPGPPGVPGRPRWCPWRHRGMAPGVKRDGQRRVVAVAPRLVEGAPAGVEPRRRRSPGAGGLNPADSARLNAPLRERLAARTRRGRARARRPVTWPHGRSRMGTVDHCGPPQARRRLAGVTTEASGLARTPALAAGITDPCWAVQARRSSHGPPPRGTPPQPRGRPARALYGLVARWCS